MILAFDDAMMQRIEKVIEYANKNIYSTDNILDMMNSQKAVPSEDPNHLILLPIARWVCYFKVDHPIKGLCHYFQIQPDAFGGPADKDEMQQILKAFEIDTPLLDEHITTDKVLRAIEIKIPVNS